MRGSSIYSRISQILIGKISAAVFGFFMFVVLTRSLDISDLGSYVFLVSVSVVISMISNWGTNELLFRQCSTDFSNAYGLLRTARLWKLFLAVSLSTLFIFYLRLTGSPTSELIAAILLLTAAAVDAQAMSFIILRRAVGDNTTEALYFPARAFFKLTLIYIVTRLTTEFAYIAVVIAFVNVAFIFVLWVQFYQENALGIEPLNRGRISFRKLLLTATPYAVMGIIGALYSQSGPILTGMISGKEVVAVYGVGLQFYQVALFLPVAINIGIQPGLSRIYEKDRSAWEVKVFKLFLRLVPLAITIGAILYIFLPTLLNMFFDQRYAGGTALIRVFMLALVFRFMTSSLIVSALISARRVNAHNRVLFAALIIHIVTLIALIPVYGAMGAAVSLLVSEVIMAVLGALVLFRVVRFG